MAQITQTTTHPRVNLTE